MLRLLLSRALPLFARVTVEGRERLDGGGYLIVCNHIGWADPIWLAYAAHPRLLHQMAKEELFRTRGAAWLLRKLGAFPVNRDRPSAGTLKHAANLLRRGELVLVFPTGTRDQAQEGARRGAAVIARMSNAAIVPAFYEGPSAIKLLDLLRRPKVRLRFGAALGPEASSSSRQAAAKFTSCLTEAMSRLQSDATVENGRSPDLRS